MLKITVTVHHVVFVHLLEALDGESVQRIKPQT